MAKFTGREIVEIVITLLVCLWILYRVADTYDLLPKNLQLFEIIQDEYEELKFALIEKTQSNDWFGQVSSDVLGVIDDVEQYIAVRKKAYDDQERIAKQCGENSIFRFFMTMDMNEDEAQHCIKGNLKLDNAIKDLNKPNTPTTPGKTSNQPNGAQQNSTGTQPRSTP